MSATAPRPARCGGSEDGFLLIELLVALVVLIVGILGMYLGFISAQKLSLVAERQVSMAQIAEQQVEYVEGIPYSEIGLSSAPTPSTSPTSPGYYVTAGSPPTFEWDRTAGSAEPLDVDTTTPGVIAPVQNWSTGRFSGQIYDFVTWATDPKCAPGCPSSADYKRITVAVTIAGNEEPHTVYVSSVVVNPAAAPAGGTSNGTAGNPLTNPATSCTNASGQTVSCTSPIDSGNPNTYYLHDWPATNGGAPTPPASNHTTHATVGAVSGLLCTTLTLLGGLLTDITGCPVPDLMDNNPPTGTSLYYYSSDQTPTPPTSAYPGGRLLQPTCSGLCSGSSGGGTDSTSDCNGGGWTSSLLNVQSELWVTSPVGANTTLTGDGGVSIFTQTLGGVSALVSFCIEIYEVPPSGGVAGSLGDLLAWPPVALGGAGYVAEADPATGGNWPTTVSQVSYIFTFSSTPVTISAGDRLGVRIWMKANINTPIDVIYDNAADPAEVQLNTQ